MATFERLLAPKSVAVVGGGAWCEAVVEQCRATGFKGEIWPVHPKRSEIGGVPAFASLDALPSVPDAAFVGVNRTLTVDILRVLSNMGCGGAVCFAAGFAEATAELSDGAALQEQLVAAAGEMPILGPNCYGFVNALDGVSLWPDMHGLDCCETGVAIIGQSSNVLINFTMQRRGLPLAMVVAAGNQAQTSMGQIGTALLEDPRITALGLHIEGISDLGAFETLAERAAALGKPIVALKVGASQQAQAAAVSHTASMVGSDAGARALLARLGIAQVDTAAQMVEVLKILHVTGGLSSRRIASASCSGGEASLMADIGAAAGLEFPPLNPKQQEGLRSALGAKVALANPLDYNTYIWGDESALVDCFTALCQGDVALACIVLDFPRADRFDAPSWDQVIRAAAKAKQVTGKPVAVVSLLPDGLLERHAAMAISLGIVPLSDMGVALPAIRAAADASTNGTNGKISHLHTRTLRPGDVVGESTVVSESEAKAMFAQAGIRVPNSTRADVGMNPGEMACKIGFPVVLKGEGIAHKTEVGAVALSLKSRAEVEEAAATMPAQSFLVEEMITETVAELLLGVTRDPAHGFVLTVGLGGILTELIRDTASLLVPASRRDVRAALMSLQSAPLLTGYRGRPAASIDAILDTIMAVQTLVETHASTLQEIEINPLMCRAGDAVAADALIRMGDAS